MSHFTVMVRVPADGVPFENVPEAIGEALAPYQENNMGTCPREFLEFEDEEDEARREYAEEDIEMIELPEGGRAYPWAERFRVPGSFGTSAESHVVPEILKRVQVPHREHWSTFEEFMKEWKGADSRDEEKQRYGHWRNPNAKWDWFAIGGRWSGKIPIVVGGFLGKGDRDTDAPPVSANRADYTRIRDIDQAAVEAQATTEAEKFFGEWVRFANGEVFQAFDGPRETALKIGLLECKDADELDGKEWRKIPWGRQLKAGVDRFDVLKEASKEAVIALHRRMESPLRTYAFVDRDGWRGPGEMGWFGSSSDTPDSLAMYADAFAAWLAGGDQTDWVAVVDCHI